MGKKWQTKCKTPPRWTGAKNGKKEDYRGSFPFFAILGPFLGPFFGPCPPGGCFPFGFPFFSPFLVFGRFPCHASPAWSQEVSLSRCRFIGIVQMVFSPNLKGVPRISDVFSTHFWLILTHFGRSSFPNKTRPSFDAFLTHFWGISDAFLTHSCYCRHLFPRTPFGRYRF